MFLEIFWQILYDDGDKEVLDMRKERWDFVTARDLQVSWWKFKKINIGVNRLK